MLRREKPFLRRWLAFAPVVPTIGVVVGHDFDRDLQDIELREQARLRAASRVIQVDVVASLAAIERVQAGLVERHGIEGNRIGLNAHMRSLREAMPDVRTLALHDASGSALFSNHPGQPGVIQDSGQREYCSMKIRQVEIPPRGKSGLYRGAL